MPDIEAPEPDAVEQAQEAMPTVGDDTPLSTSIDANEADLQEQHQEEPIEDDDYGR